MKILIYVMRQILISIFIVRQRYKGPLFGACIVAFATILGSWTFGTNYGVPLLIFLITLFLLGFTQDCICTFLTKHLTKLKFKNPTINIITSKIIDNKEMEKLLDIGKVKFLPEKWISCLEPFKAEKIEYTDIVIDSPMIINPFGELYLEEDLANLKTLKQIKDYIENGGVYVNVGGLAFYSNWDPKLKEQGFTGSPVETYMISIIDNKNVLMPVSLPGTYTSLTNTWLHKNFGVRTTIALEVINKEIISNKGVISNVMDVSKVREFRSAIRCESKDTKLVPILIAKNCYPIAAIKYGLGYLIIVGIQLKEEKCLNPVIKVIKEICNKLSREGSLES